MVTALGTHSPQLHQVRALLERRGRRDQGRFSFEGPTLLAEAVASGTQIEALYATQRAYESLPAALVESLSCPVYLISERALRKVSDLETPSGVLAVAATRFIELDRLLSGGATALLLARVADPGNAGTLLRSAEAFGVDGVLFDEEVVDAYNPKVVRASMGSIFRQRCAVVELQELAQKAHRERYALVATDRRGVPLPQFAFPERCIIAVGHERTGLSGRHVEWDAAVAIPQEGKVDSLNAAMAGCIVLYEHARQRRLRSSDVSTRNNA
ncbi:MAG: RNA methyltransferase [Candidatus Eremiobacteraeota bacterium]|nr:RNA methyltransferase [Candidatus Eremiobacteraeota bacterium]MBV9648020.1 RNA methyltransferase [Candidatus Eremiobacteraeota bacterium]